MGVLDQTARFAVKLAPAELLRWLLPSLDTDLAFTRWLDTETIAFPGEPRRRCDTVAELVSRGGGTAPWALVVEVEARPRATIIDRLLEYVARLLRKLRHGPHRRDKYQVAAVLIFLTGRREDLILDMHLPGTDIGLGWKVRVLSLASEEASATLVRIARGELGRSILPWIPLMSGGGEGAVVQEWVRLVSEEPGTERRAEYAGLALVFAERAGRLAVWKEALEGLNVWESQVALEWKNAGRQEAMRSALSKVLRSRFQAELPASITDAVQQATDPEVLSRWFDASLTAASLEAFAQLIQPSTAPPTEPNG
jgi:hypothetical protein